MAAETPSVESQRIFAPGTFDGAVALITGGGSGIGLATAQEIVRLGGSVAICGRTEAKLEAAKQEIEAVSAGGEVFAAPCDIREPEAIEAYVAKVVDALGDIDILVNNAGGQFPSPAQMISPKGFSAVIRNNLLGTFNMTREVANRSMIPRKKGRVVNVIANIYRGFPAWFTRAPPARASRT